MTASSVILKHFPREKHIFFQSLLYRNHAFVLFSVHPSVHSLVSATSPNQINWYCYNFTQLLYTKWGCAWRKIISVWKISPEMIGLKVLYLFYGTSNIWHCCRNGEITDLSVHAIVHSTNERMTEKSRNTDSLYAKAGPKMEAEIRNNIKSKYKTN